MKTYLVHEDFPFAIDRGWGVSADNPQDAAERFVGQRYRRRGRTEELVVRVRDDDTGVVTRWRVGAGMVLEARATEAEERACPE